MMQESQDLIDEMEEFHTFLQTLENFNCSGVFQSPEIVPVEVHR